MLFEELSHMKKIEEPEERKAEALKRAPKRFKGLGRKKSVSLRTVQVTLTIIGFLGACAIIAGILYLGYLGYNVYANG